MLADEGAEGVAGVAGRCGRREFLVDLVADLQPDRTRCGKARVVAAGIQRNRQIEQWFAGLQRDGGTARLRLRDARYRSGVDRRRVRVAGGGA